MQSRSSNGTKQDITNKCMLTYFYLEICMFSVFDFRSLFFSVETLQKKLLCERVCSYASLVVRYPYPVMAKLDENTASMVVNILPRQCVHK